MARPLQSFALNFAEEVRHRLALIEQVHGQAQVRQESHIRLVALWRARITLEAKEKIKLLVLLGFS
jgi:hypothetical protein